MKNNLTAFQLLELAYEKYLLELVEAKDFSQDEINILDIDMSRELIDHMDSLISDFIYNKTSEATS